MMSKSKKEKWSFLKFEEKKLVDILLKSVLLKLIPKQVLCQIQFGTK